MEAEEGVGIPDGTFRSGAMGAGSTSTTHTPHHSNPFSTTTNIDRGGGGGGGARAQPSFGSTPKHVGAGMSVAQAAAAAATSASGLTFASGVGGGGGAFQGGVAEAKFSTTASDASGNPGQQKRGLEQNPPGWIPGFSDFCNWKGGNVRRQQVDMKRTIEHSRSVALPQSLSLYNTSIIKFLSNPLFQPTAIFSSPFISSKQPSTCTNGQNVQQG